MSCRGRGSTHGGRAEASGHPPMRKFFDGLPGPLKECWFLLPLLRMHRRTKGHRCLERNQDEISFRQDSVQVLQKDGNQLDIRMLLREMPEPRFELTHLA